ncbi:hypothetical protein LIER_13816 [Lithospermum erythrorhizon]|uniref:Uncharacterized protein n=1 Tax=Lithospermum erythrorhizon TaxID=34254 RepID=A0AAV3Q1E2_LITER
MEKFNNCLDVLDVTELSGHGHRFTWSSNWMNRECLSRLDHVFCNMEWMQSFPLSFVHIQPPGISDHCSLRVKKSLVELNLNHYVDISNRVKNTSKELNDVQKKIYNGELSNDLLTLERNLRSELLRFSRAELLKNKSRMAYLEKGDFNNAFFSRLVLAYTSKHKISVFEDLSGNFYNEPEDVEKVITTFYQEFFTSQGPLTIAQRETVKRVIKARVPEEYLTRLNASPTMAEVKDAFHGLSYGKSSRPNGLVAEFFKYNWGRIGGDVFKAVQHIFATSDFPPNMNSTLISLIRWSIPRI